MPYAVIGGNAVMAWVEQADESAVRFTQDVDLVLQREDLDRVRDAVRVNFCGEKVRPDYVAAVPGVSAVALRKMLPAMEPAMASEPHEL